MNHLHSARRRNELFYCARGSANAHPAALRRARHPRGSFGQIQHFERCMKIWNGDLHEKKRSTAAELRCARQPVAGPDPHALMARSAAAPVCAGPRITVISNLNDVLTAALRSALLHYPAKIFLLFPNSGPAITASQHRERRKKFQTKTAFGLISVQVSLFASTPVTKWTGLNCLLASAHYSRHPPHRHSVGKMFHPRILNKCATQKIFVWYFLAGTHWLLAILAHTL